MAGFDPDEIEVDNRILDELIEFYDCADFLPFVRRLGWLRDVKEALGYIPPRFFNIDYDDIRGLVILQREVNLRESSESYKQRRQAEQQRARMPKVPRGRGSHRMPR